jgi:hypothetical protein
VPTATAARRSIPSSPTPRSMSPAGTSSRAPTARQEPDRAGQLRTGAPSRTASPSARRPGVPRWRRSPRRRARTPRGPPRRPPRGSAASGPVDPRRARSRARGPRPPRRSPSTARRRAARGGGTGQVAVERPSETRGDDEERAGQAAAEQVQEAPPDRHATSAPACGHERRAEEDRAAPEEGTAIRPSGTRRRAGGTRPMRTRSRAPEKATAPRRPPRCSQQGKSERHPPARPGGRSEERRQRGPREVEPAGGPENAVEQHLRRGASRRRTSPRRTAWQEAPQAPPAALGQARAPGPRPSGSAGRTVRGRSGDTQTLRGRLGAVRPSRCAVRPRDDLGREGMLPAPWPRSCSSPRSSPARRRSPPRSSGSVRSGRGVGTTAEALAVVSAAFLGGLGIGAALSARPPRPTRTRSRRRLVRDRRGRPHLPLAARARLRAGRAPGRPPSPAPAAERLVLARGGRGAPDPGDPDGVPRSHAPLPGPGCPEGRQARRPGDRLALRHQHARRGDGRLARDVASPPGVRGDVLPATRGLREPAGGPAS